ncbi:MAG: TetR/AcrR family transcriptional regulator [Bacteroidota bacterium]
MRLNKSSFIFAGLKQRDENKIQQIFAATLQLVVNRGVAGVTMRQIARQAGMATGTLYIYFKDKDELINQLYSSCRAASVDAYFKGYDDEITFKKGFKVIWNNILQYRMNNFDVSVFMEQCFHSPFMTESTKEMNQQLLQPLYKLIERGKEEKMLKDLDTVMLLIFMMASITAVIKYVNYHKKKITVDLIKEAFGICWDGLKS